MLLGAKVQYDTDFTVTKSLLIRQVL